MTGRTALPVQSHNSLYAARSRLSAGAASLQAATFSTCNSRLVEPAAPATLSTCRPGSRSACICAAAHADVQRRAEPQQPPTWEQLEALYESDRYPAFAASPWQSGLPAPIEAGTLQQLLRPVGGLLQLAVKLEESPQHLKEQEEQRRKRQDYYANVGDAIRTLREEIPLLFYADLTYDIYRDDVVFKDPRNTLRGKQNYRRLFKGLRLFGRLCFTRCRVDVVRIWQPESNRISMRWQFHGVPRIPWEVEGILDGVSQFKLDKEGKIYEHSVDNVVLRDPPLGISPLWTSLNRIFNPQPQPCPGINFDDNSKEGPAASPPVYASQRRWIALVHVAPAERSQQPREFLLE